MNSPSAASALPRAGLQVLVPLLLGMILLSLSEAVSARSIEFDNGITFDYKITTTYAAAMRLRDPHGQLVDGPIDPLEPQLLPDPINGQQQVVGFAHTGLPTTINSDDGNRNFDQFSLINNRVSGLAELKLVWRDFGLVYSGSAFYDEVYDRNNANNSPETVNKTGQANAFTDGARYYDGKRSRSLEAYAYADFYVLEDSVFSLKLGKHLVAYGESLFLPGISLAMAPNDATKAFVPGSEIKDILLPVWQASFNFSYGYNLNLFGFYHFDWQPTEVFPAGDLFSPADIIGPGATFAYGSINPAALNGCPGLLGPLSPLCNVGGLGQPLLNAPRTINVQRLPDIRPDDDDQFGGGVRYQVTSTTNLGLYAMRYHSHNPTVQLNTDFAFIGEVGGQPVTTGLVNQYVPTTYNVKYFDDINLYAASFSTVLAPFNVGGEVIYRDGIDVSVQSIISGVLSPIFVRGKVYSGQVSAIYASNPRFLWYEELAFVSEAKYVYVAEKDRLPAQNGVEPVGGGDRLFYDRNAWGYQMLVLLNSRNILPGWDLKNAFAWAHAANGNPSVPGDFGPLLGEGDRRFVFGVGMQYLQNLEFGVTYNRFLGNPRKGVRGTPIVKQNPLSDRDYVTFTIKYNL